MGSPTPLPHITLDLDLRLDSRTGSRCRGPMVRAFRPEWDRSASQSRDEPPASKGVNALPYSNPIASASTFAAWCFPRANQREATGAARQDHHACAEAV